ncbi:hypothetical protein MTO96_021402 [Rhipicephalus appendiculatus]
MLVPEKSRLGRDAIRSSVVVAPKGRGPVRLWRDGKVFLATFLGAHSPRLAMCAPDAPEHSSLSSSSTTCSVPPPLGLDAC